jgi:hypothetical protein
VGDLAELLAARSFIQRAILGPGYHFPDELDEFVVLTEVGEHWRGQSRQQFAEATDSDIRAALLTRYAGGDQPFVDVPATHTGRLIDVLSSEVKERRLNFPMVFGRLLSDRFVENFGTVPIASMTPEQSQQLLRITPQGVFQHGSIVSGPFGLLRSAGRRHLPPQSCGPAIRCSEIACSQLHHITMRTTETAGSRVYEFLGNEVPESLQLSKAITDIELPDEEYYRINHPGALAWLLGNGFTSEELAEVTTWLVKSNFAQLRQTLNSIVHLDSLRNSPAVQLVGALDAAGILQVLLLLSDQDLVAGVEKLGHKIPAPSRIDEPLCRLLDELTVSVRTPHATPEMRIASIRSAGINMFVELEGFLRRSSDFACWALLGDHYDVHPMLRFRYSESLASVFSAKMFGEAARERGDAFPYDDTFGRNGLSVLVQSFRVVANLCDDVLESETAYRRPRWKFPSFAGLSDVQSFPLNHTALILDLRPDCRERLQDVLRAVTLQLTRTDICEVRNRLGHSRERFPDNEEILRSVDEIRQAVTVLSSEGLSPIVRQYSGETNDAFQRRFVRLADGSGAEILLTAPSQVMWIDLPPYDVPQVVLVGGRLANTLQPARFEVVCESPWSRLWRGVGLIDSWLHGPKQNSIPTDTVLPSDATGSPV